MPIWGVYPNISLNLQSKHKLILDILSYLHTTRLHTKFQIDPLTNN